MAETNYFLNLVNGIAPEGWTITTSPTEHGTMWEARSPQGGYIMYHEPKPVSWEQILRDMPSTPRENDGIWEIGKINNVRIVLDE